MIKYYKNTFNYQHLSFEKINPEEYHQHMHPSYEFLYFLNGDADYVINATIYHLVPGTLLFIPANSWHYLDPKENSSYERICIHFTKNTIPQELFSIISTFKPIYLIEKKTPIDRIFSSLLKCEYNYNYTKKDMLFLIEQEIGNILTHLKYYQNEVSPISVLQNDDLKQIITYIDTHLNEPLSTALLSHKFFKSPSWITHAFTKFLKIPPQKYINNKKILYAKELITEGNPPMLVAKKLSFENYATFYRAYLKFIGNPPNQDYSTENH